MKKKNITNSWNNPLLSCHVAFPTIRDSKKWIDKHLETVLMPDNVSVEISVEYIETKEDPEDGIPAFYINVVTLKKKR